MKAAGIPCIPGSAGALPDDMNEIQRLAKKLGYPVVVIAAGASAAPAGPNPIIATSKCSIFLSAKMKMAIR